MFIYITTRYNCGGTFDSIVHWTKTIIFSGYVYIILLRTIDCLTNIESVLLWYFWTQFFETVKDIHKLPFQSTTTSADTKFKLPQHSDNLETDGYHGSTDCYEVDLELYINRLDSGNPRQSTTIPSQCDQFSWSWTWRLLYFYHCYHCKKRLGII